MAVAKQRQEKEASQRSAATSSHSGNLTRGNAVLTAACGLAGESRRRRRVCGNSFSLLHYYNSASATGTLGLERSQLSRGRDVH